MGAGRGRGVKGGGDGGGGGEEEVLYYNMEIPVCTTFDSNTQTSFYESFNQLPGTKADCFVRPISCKMSLETRAMEKPFRIPVSTL